MVRAHKDLEFNKGETAYDRWQGDPGVRTNGFLGSIDTAPFYGLTLWPGDMGTFCGLVTDAEARVLDECNRPIPGLYACGCDMHRCFQDPIPAAEVRSAQG